MVKKLAFYDLDGCLINSPTPDEGKIIWKEKTGEDWPHKGWWYEPDSLNTDVFDIKTYPNIVNQLQKDNADPETYTLLLTGRLENMSEQIREILNTHGLHFDDYNFAQKPEEPKTERIKKYLEKFPEANDVVVYDDRDKEIRKFKEFKDKIRIFGIDFEIQQANKGALTLVESMIKEEIEKNFLNEGINLEKIRNFVSMLKNKANVVMRIFDKLKNTTNPITKKYLMAILLFLTFGHKLGRADNLVNSLTDKLIFEEITTFNDFVNTTKKLVKQDETLLQAIKPILPNKFNGKSVNQLTKNDAIRHGLIDGVFEVDKDLMSQLRQINKKRFTSKYLSRYNQFDINIENALYELKEKGENPNMSLIKAIMMIESGMIPRKNWLGFHGFPQTKWKYVKPINKKFGTNFTMDDLYNPDKSAQFIHYYMKALAPLPYVNNFKDFAASYNMGVGNYKKYLEGKRDMSPETKEYVQLTKTIMNHIKQKDNDEKES
jgi:hypothetical protein